MFQEYYTHAKHRSLIGGFHVLTVGTMGSAVFWDITSCSPLEVRRRSGVTYCLYLQDGRLSQVSSQQKAGGEQRFLTGHLLALFFIPEGSMFL
jgi:hypothetical protein